MGLLHWLLLLPNCLYNNLYSLDKYILIYSNDIYNLNNYYNLYIYILYNLLLQDTIRTATMKDLAILVPRGITNFPMNDEIMTGYIITRPV